MSNGIIDFSKYIAFSYVPLEEDEMKFRLDVDFICPPDFDIDNVCLGLYCFRRFKLKNYTSLLPLQKEQQQYQFPINLPDGFYDVKILRMEGLKYLELYTEKKIHVTKVPALQISANFLPQKSVLSVTLNHSPFKGDYFGVFFSSTDSMREKHMIDHTKHFFSSAKKECFFRVNSDFFEKGKEYEIRYFRGDCSIEAINYVTKWDITFIPSAISNTFSV
ncbi:hypothetical protein EIN_484830 [Entamoeba invadens IP1]|uniref:Uncharacterized protein n=1 Tax=Entamoeba invadens IP1 TaxID=370355 RepID=A0A0A1U4G1_ENTIV|nr:hypothetical protein EIN_484830 [Entamoeba invadens IP1]ELP89141.1 hypothetical protein EIN_484830 [Entamoeba invadens IP1]|eukprot:XP_004255912.1 hypothetical protein EIN_484830 [Entamoeba invadens IP1]